MVSALSAGNLSSSRAGTQISGIRTCLQAEDEGPKQGLSQKLCPFGLSQKLLASVVHPLSCADYSWRDPGIKMSSPGAVAKSSRAGWTPLLWQGRCPAIWCLNLPPGRSCDPLTEVLKSRGESCVYLTVVCRLHAQGNPVVAWTGRDLCP